MSVIPQQPRPTTANDAAVGVALSIRVLETDASGTLLRKYPFADPAKFKQSIVQEDKRFAKAFTSHLLRFALARELSPADALTVDQIVENTAKDNFKLRPIIREVIRSKSFQE